MNKRTVGWLITAASLLLVGIFSLGGAMAMLNWDFSKLSTVKYETNKHEITEDYQNIRVVTDTANVVFLPAEDSCSTVTCREAKKVKHSVSVIDNTLVIETVDTRKWYDHIGVDFGNTKITVSIPQGTYGTLLLKNRTGSTEIPADFAFESIDATASTGKITCYASAAKHLNAKTDTGSILVGNNSVGSLTLSATTGDITVNSVTCGGTVSANVTTGSTKFTDVTCQSFTSKGATGGLSMQNVVATEAFSISRSTGNITFDRCDASEITVKTDTGNVKGTLLTDKVFIAQSDTGRINVPKTITGGKCEITTDTGNITIHIVE